MATSADYANWLRNNQNKRGTPNYATVLRAYQEAALEENQAAQAPAPAAPAAKPESGFFPALRSGATELGGGISALLGRLGFKDEAAAQAEFDAAQKRSREIFAPTEEWGLTKGLELLGGSIPYMAAPLVAGAAATTLPLTGPAALVTTLGAAGLTSAAQFTATNLSRQMEEGKKLADTDLGAAALAAVPQALLDTAAMRLIPGIGRIFGQAGIKVTPETAKEIAEQALKKTLIDYTAATGKTMGVEGLTEATQQVLERAQAGLSLTDPKARDEYFDSFIGGAVLGGTLAVPGRYLERSDAQGKARELLGAQEAEKRKVAAAAEQARRASPDYLESVFTAYDTLAKQDAALKAQIKKGSKEAPLSQEDKDANAVINKQLEALKSPLEQARKEYLAAGGPQALAKMRAGQLELASPEGRVSEPVATEETDEEKTARLRRDLPGLESLLARQLQDVKSAATPEEALTLAQRAAATRKAVDTARAAAPAEPKIDETELTKRIKRLEKQYQDAREKGDEAAVMKVAPELIAAREEVETLRKQREAQRMDTGLFAPEAVAAEEARRVALGEEMGAGREAAAYERLQSRLEQETAREEAARRAQVDAELAAEGTAEREAMQELAQDLAYRQRMRGYGELGREQQFELFPQPREKVEQKTADIASELRKLQERIAELEKRRAEKQALPQEELAGALSREPGQIVDIDKRLAETRQRLNDLQESDLERRTVRVLPEAPQVDVRKKPELAQQVAALADRVVAAPGVDEQTKDVVRQIQADVPGFLRAATAQTAESVREQERRAAATKTGAPAESFAAPTALFNPSQVATWLYRTLTTGRADPADTARASGVLRTLAEGKRSETETLPSGEVRRAVQQELPAMPEPRATAFNTYEEFEDYLATAAPLMVDAQGRVRLSIARLQRDLAPLREQAANLRGQEAALKQQAAELSQKTGAERAAAQAKLDEAKFSFAIAKNALENYVERVVAARSITVQQYSDALTEGVRLALDIVEGAKQFETRIAADESLDAAVKKAEKETQTALEAWAKADADKAAVVQENMGIEGAWNEGSAGLKKYLVSKVNAASALETLKNAQTVLKNATKARKATTPLSSKAFGDFLVKQAEITAKLDVALGQISGLAGAVKTAAKQGTIDAYLKQRDAAQVALSKALQALPVGGDVGATLRNHLKPLDDALTALADRLGTYAGTPEQFAALNKARADLNVAEARVAELAVAVRPDDAQAQQLLAAAKTAATQAGKLESTVESRLAGAKARAEARTRLQPAPAQTTLAEREARDAAKRRAEQASLEAGEKAGVMVFFEKNKEDIMADTNYIALVEQSYDTNLSTQERMKAAEEADKYMQEKRQRIEARAEKTAAASQLHEENLKNARDKLAKLKELRGTKRTDATKAKLEEAIKKQEAVVAGHQAKLNKALTGTKITRMSRGDLKAIRAKVHADVREDAAKGRRALFSGMVEGEGVRTVEPGERLGVAEGTQQRAIGPATRAEVVPPKTLRTGSEESRAGETTTPARNRIQEARGQTQRDVPMTRKEQAEANVIAAENAVAAAKTPSEKRLAEAQLAVAEARYEIVTKGDSDTRAQQLAEAEKELAALTLSKVKLSEKTPLTAKEEAAIAKEQAKEAAPTKVRPLSQAAEKRKKVSEVVEETAYEAPEIEILGGPREEVYLSRGATANPSTTDSVRTELKPHFPDLGRVQVYDSVEALVKANPQYKGRIPDDARGFVDRAGNKAFLIAENINQGQALSVLLHEVGAHIGMKNLLGDAQYNAFVNAVERWQKAPATSAEGRVARAAQARVEAAQTPESQQRDELLAYAVEEAVNAGITPQTKSPLGQWLGRIVQRMEAAVRRFFGMEPKGISLRDLVNTAYGAAKVEMQPATPQMSRRTFLRGASAAVGAMKLPPLSKEMNLQALRSVFDGSFDARDAWFGALNTATKNRGIKSLMGEFEDLYEGDNALVNFTRSKELQSFLYNLNYDYYDYEGDGYDYYLNEMLSGKDGVKVVADLQQALQAQGKALVDAVKKYGEERGALPEVGELFFSKNLPTASRVASNLVGGQKGFVDKLRDNFLGMGVRTQYIDKLFPTEEALKRGGVNDKDAMQAMYYLRMYDQRMHFTSQAMTVGVPERVEKTRRDGTKEFLIEAKDGANLKQAFDILKRKAVVKEAGSADAANKLVTLYMAAIRGERVGYDTLNFGRAWASAEIARIEGELKSPKLSAEQRTNLTKRKDRLSKRLDSMPSPADIKAAKAEIDANPVLREAFNEVRDIYNQYNRDLLNFNVQTGAISRELANKLLQESDYIPYYRVRDGVAELLIGKETPIRIGNLKDSPHLQELVGGDEPVMDFITSSIQNTSMLIDMATHNLAMRNLMFEFRDVGLATIGKTKGGKAPEGAVTFKVDGVEHYGVVDTEMLGISSDLLVKGLAGIPTMFPTLIRVMGMPARFLRRLIVASPVYMARQLFRDSLGASIASGANTIPLLSALKQIGKTDVLERRGITGGQVFTGMPEDMSRMIKDMQAGKISFNNGLAWLESKAAQADALTRRSQYESYLQQGLSEMEATYMALESMNFSRRGLSPSIHMASALIPFFNTQIQGLDVLYRSFRGKMPMNERLNVRRKLLVRGMMLFGLSFAYALAMQDDEAYKNAKPEDKYGNWFVPLDKLGIKEPLRLPIPFELGYIFKALPEAIVNILMAKDAQRDFTVDERGRAIDTAGNVLEAQKALKHIGQQIVPGLSNFFIPQAVKPALEVAFGTSIYTGRDIEPAREQGVEPGYRTQASTTELAKAVGEMTGFSPIKLEFLIRGYTGQMGMAAIAALSAPFAGAGEGPAPATKRYSDLPLIGTLFQPKDASGIVDLVYERMNKVRQAQETYERFVSEGKQEKAAQYAKEKADELSLASVAGAFRQQMGEITDYERRVRASNLSPERKREELDRATQAKITLSKTVQAMSGRRTPQAAPA